MSALRRGLHIRNYRRYATRLQSVLQSFCRTHSRILHISCYSALDSLSTSFSHLPFFPCSLSLFDILTSGAGLRRGRFGLLWDVASIFGFETIAAHLGRL